MISRGLVREHSCNTADGGSVAGGRVGSRNAWRPTVHDVGGGRRVIDAVQVAVPKSKPLGNGGGKRTGGNFWCLAVHLSFDSVQWEIPHCSVICDVICDLSQAVIQPEMALNRVTLPSGVEGGGMYRWNRTDLGLPNLLTPHAHIATSCSYIIGEYTPFLKPHTFSLCFC